jgi:hypothetical protein
VPTPFDYDANPARILDIGYGEGAVRAALPFAERVATPVTLTKRGALILARKGTAP